MSASLKWIGTGILLAGVFLLTATVDPQQVFAKLTTIAQEVKPFSALNHLVFLLALAAGLWVAKLRDRVWFILLAYLNLSALVIAIKYLLIPNIVIFGLFLGLITHAHFKGKLNFQLSSQPRANLFFGIIGLVFGFWYLHWVDTPLALNALLYSPLGLLNCPTMLMVCAFLCLTREPRSPLLEAVVAVTTLFFGFYGVMLLGAYVDVALIIVALFLLVRLGARMPSAWLNPAGQATASNMRGSL